ncbi:MAG TPA: S9 family peptidase [Bacteroidota bacterium]|nr:S9 family peptidase [Bacteroidota bacterium]
MIFSLLMLLAAGTAATDTSLLTLDRIFASGEFSSHPPGPFEWVDGGKGYTSLERPADGGTGREIVRYDAATGLRSVLVPISRLTPAGSATPVAIEQYAWSGDQSRLLIFTNSRRVWRQNTRGDYWLLGMSDGTLRKLGGDAPPSSLMFAKFSPDGRRVAYVRGNNIYTEDAATGRIVQLTHDGSTTIINGTFDWVYEEEFSLRDGFRWSPDGSSIAYWQLDAAAVRDFLLINDTDSLYSFTIPVQYPKVGTALSSCRVGVVSSTGGPTRWIELPGNPAEHYIPRMDWAGNSSAIAFQRMNRLQDTNRLVLADVRTGSTRTLLEDTDSTWVEVVDDLRWMDGGRRFTWMSERDGWKHLYRYDREGGAAELLTAGPYDVEAVVRADTGGRWVYFIASPENPAQRYLYRLSAAARPAVERITPADEPGTHRYDIAPDGAWAIDTWSRFGVPPVVNLVSLPDHRIVRVLAPNRALRENVARLRHGEFSFFRVDIGGGVQLDGWKMLPPGFDPEKRYPVLQHIYGEPAGQTVADRWGGSQYLWHLMLTQQGYIVISIDNRGTAAPRGRLWRRSIYRQIGILASADQAAAIREVRTWPFVDSARIGIWGWSGGGSMTLNMILRYPSLYQTGMAVAPVPDQRLYDATYQERYMGLLSGNGEGYRLGSPVTFADSLRGNLLLVHGTGDDNVHYQGSERLINAFIRAGKQFTMMAYPNRSHGIFEGTGTTRHLYGLLTEYLIAHMMPGPVPR